MGRKNEFPELEAIGLYAADTVGNGMIPLPPLLQCPHFPY